MSIYGPQPVVVAPQPTTAVVLEEKKGISWLWYMLLALAFIAVAVIAIVALVIATSNRTKLNNLTTATNASIASLQAQVNAIAGGGSTGAIQSVRYSGGVGSTDPFQTIAGSSSAGTAVLFHQEVKQSADITYDTTTGVFTAAKAGLYNISFDVQVVMTADADGQGELAGYVSVGAATFTSVKYGEIRVPAPESFAIPAVPAWPISVCTSVRLAAGDEFSCILQLFNASTGIIPGAGATAPLDVNPAQANFSCVRVAG